jgi:hypothetical protein
MVVGSIWASDGCHIADSDIVSEFRVDMVLAVIGNFDDLIVGITIGSIVGELSRRLLCPFSVVNNRSAVVKSNTY